MNGDQNVAIASQPAKEETPAPRRSAVFRNIRAASLAPQISDARPSNLRRTTSLQTGRDMAVVVPFSLDLSGEFRLSCIGNKPSEGSGRREAFVGPVPLPAQQPSHLSNSFTMFGYSLAPLYDFWERFQVSHCGQYSVERMLALNEYCQRTSFKRVLAVCFLTPLIPLLVVILMELVPLRPGADGARANYVFWARHALTIAITIMCAQMQATSWIPELPLSIKQGFIIAVGTSIVTSGIELLVAELWVFPIPFLSIVGAPLLLLFWAILTRVVLGPDPVLGVQDAEFRSRRFLQIIFVQMSLLLVYPAYQAVSITVNGVFQMLTVSLLPVINVALKNTLVACGAHLEDNLPEMVVLTVDGFSALYSVICMRGANSLKMVAITVMLNVVVMALSLHGMNRRSRAARESRTFHLMQLQQRQALRTPSFLTAASGGGSPELLSTLVLTTLKLLRAPGQLDPAELREIRLLSGMQHKLSDANSALLQVLASRAVYNNNRMVSNALLMSQMKSRYASAAIEGRVLSTSHFGVPSPPTSQLAQRIRAGIRATFMRIGSEVGTRLGSFRRSGDKTSDGDSGGDSVHRLPSVSQIEKLGKTSSHWISYRKKVLPLDPLSSTQLRSLVIAGKPIISDILTETQRKNTRAVKQSLQLLFNNEYLGLIAYIQCIIPVLYMLYMPILQTLPNRVYYPAHVVLMEEDGQFLNRMTMIAMLALLQFSVLIVLHIFVATRFAVSTIYQIAFVLETHFRLVEGRLIVWFIFVVQSTLLHCGNDFSFHFDWLHDRQGGTT